MSNIDKQALRADALEATGGSWVRESGEGWEAICCDDDQGNAGFIIAEFQGENATANRKFVQSANPATVLALLDELEAKDKSIGFLKDQLAQLANFNPDWDKLEAATDSLREHMDELTAARTRIAELEALQRKPVMFIDGDISPSDAEKLAAVISEFNEETETPAARMARIIRENPHPTNMCDMPGAGTAKGE
ncbi:ead/Ea22-like family protein [Enterobacter hormaechei]